MKQTPETIVLVNFGCEDIQKFARSIRDRHIYTMVMPYTVPVERVMEEKPVGLILCADAGTPERPGAREKFEALKLPILDLTSGTGTGDVDAAVAFCCQCGCHGSWTMEKFIDEAVADIRRQVGSAKVVLGLSGGVDSSVVAALIHKAIGRQLTCVFVNHGLLRKNEPELVQEIFARNFDMNLCYIDASDRFLDKLKGVADPEQKRKIIGAEFVRVFEEESKKLPDVKFLAQGTIYPDVIESGGSKAATIKSHHNVGGLPKDMRFEGVVEPLRGLFKDEVRALGRQLGLPRRFVERQPFPGPGLGVRVLGELTAEKVRILQDADAIFREEVIRHRVRADQYFAVLTGIRSVGVVGDFRTYDYTIALRAVRTSDFMTCEYAPISHNVLGIVSSRIVNEVKGAGRVVYDITGKPPATIEWE